MYSQANVRALKVVRPPAVRDRGLYERVVGSGWARENAKKSALGGKVIAPGCASKPAPCQETSYTATKSNQESSFTRREKNHSLFH